MKSNIFLMILLQILLIALNAVFAAAEIAVLSVNENKLNKLAEDGNRRARRLLKLSRWRDSWEAPLPPTTLRVPS